MKLQEFSVILGVLLVTGQAYGQANFASDPPYYSQMYMSMPGSRGLILDEAGDIVAQGGQGLRVIYNQPNGDGTENVCKITLLEGTGLGLNHGLAYNQGYLYASSPNNVYRWPYTPGQRTLITAPAQLVVNNMPGGGHDTKELEFDSQNRLYVQVGSAGNVDRDSSRSRIRRFNIQQGGFPINFESGEVFADGLRNEAGLGWDPQGVLWGVENGMDNLGRPDLGGDIHNGNPAEEMNQFNRPAGSHYGYPYCFSVYDLPGVEARTQFADPSHMNDGVHTDAWCQNRNNVEPPALSMPAHQAPLGIHFYKGQNCNGVGAFPCRASGDAFVAFHGSWNSDRKVGYKVTQYVFNKITLLPSGEAIDIIYGPNPDGQCNNCIRPVKAIFNNEGHMIMGCDSCGDLYRVTYGTPPPRIVGGCRNED